MSDILVKVYGERHTGTNLVERTLSKWPGVRLARDQEGIRRAKDQARQVRTLVGGRMSPRAFRLIHETLVDEFILSQGPIGAWKHAAARFSDEFAASRVRVLFVVKAPGAWLTSFFRRPYHRLTTSPPNETLADFAGAPWISVGRELIASVLPTPLELWNIKVGSYLDFAAAAEKSGMTCAFVRSEDLVMNQIGELERIAAWLGIARTKISERLQSVKGADRTLSDLKEYYGKELWRAEINPNVADLIASTIDVPRAEGFGYRVA